MFLSLLIINMSKPTVELCKYGPMCPEKDSTCKRTHSVKTPCKNPDCDNPRCAFTHSKKSTNHSTPCHSVPNRSTSKYHNSIPPSPQKYHTMEPASSMVIFDQYMEMKKKYDDMAKENAKLKDKIKRLKEEKEEIESERDELQSELDLFTEPSKKKKSKK